ncbi:MAG: TauD/TfdA family dioxygenase [Burkholderiales bacterium]
MDITPLTEAFGAVVRCGRGETLADVDRDTIVGLFKERGVVLFKDYDADLDAFNGFAARFGSEFMTYKGGGYIRSKAKGGDDQTLLSVSYDYGREKQDTFGLPLHGEMYYVDNRPVMLWFYCAKPPVADGETTICDGSGVYRELTPATRKLFESQRLKYIRHYLDGEWQKIYQTDDIEEAEKFCLWNGLQVKLDRSARSISTEYLHPAIITSHWGNHAVYINNILPVLWQEQMGRQTSIVRFEDGSKIPSEVVDEVVGVQQRLIYPIAWERNNFVMIDNTRIQHGRRAFTDTDREIYLRMVRSVDF